MWIHSYPWLVGLWLTSVAMLFYSHWMCMISDPGIVENYLEPEALVTPPKLYLPFCAHYCAKCQELGKGEGRLHWKPPRAYHCKHCENCVFMMDHHCPWINNCVGYFNIRFFVQFLQWLFIHSFFTLVLTLNILWRTNYSIRNLDNFSTTGYKTVWEILFFNRVAMTLLCCFLGFWFSLSFFVEMNDYFQYNQTLVETWKDVRGGGFIYPMIGYRDDDGTLPLEMEGDDEEPLRRLHTDIRNDALPALIDSDEGMFWQNWIMHRSIHPPNDIAPSIRAVYSGVVGYNLFTALIPSYHPIFVNFADTPWSTHTSKNHPCYNRNCAGSENHYDGRHDGMTLHPASWQIDAQQEHESADSGRLRIDKSTIKLNLEAGQFGFKRVTQESEDEDGS